MSAPAEIGLPPGVVGTIDHVGLAVPDLESAIASHTQVLGLRLVHREENRDQGVAEANVGRARRRTGRLTLCGSAVCGCSMIQPGPEHGGSRINFVHPQDAAAS